MSDPGSTLAGRQLGGYLRAARQQLGATIDQTAQASEISPSVLQRLEKGASTRLKVRDIQALCSILEMSTETTSAMVGLLLKADEKSWWHAYGDVIPATFDVYVGLESGASELTMYQPSQVPGLLQTADYARSLILNRMETSTEGERRRVLDLRLERQNLVTRKFDPLALNVLVNEAALRCLVGGRAIMAEQLRHLAEIGKRSNVSIRVLPYDVGMPLGHPIGQYALLQFATTGAPPVVYLEGFSGCAYLEKPEDILLYRDATLQLSRRALDEDASRLLIRSVAKEHDSGE
ncbi:MULTISPECIES: helix-turn-helix domain-containing protein [Nocardia]|uniref:helix-turn-helix domain-containing protein n=1 Tax=Nocardia TaxID=1817 RepID=UPI000D695269|nr:MULTISPECIES: helix-turn-helix transcriptional regulator [Nocardia]